MSYKKTITTEKEAEKFALSKDINHKRRAASLGKDKKMKSISLRIAIVLLLLAGFGYVGAMDYEDAQSRPGKTQHQLDWEAAHEN